jgi:sugar (pentulose or hexulose) kinase/phosphoglycerate dehydrogenase-like enzyme/ribulose-5-phosphate 4-epimerase/fuculose-1-phosphate aldolase/putative sterol carrier protein
MANRFLMGLDVGGRSGKCVLLNVQTGSVTVTSRSWRPTPVPGSGGFGYQIDTQHFLQLLTETIREGLQRTGAKPAEVAGIAVTSTRHSLVVLDKDGRELLASPNRDGRAGGEGMQLGMEHGTELYQRTGHFPVAIFAAVRLLWLKNTFPDLFSAAKVAFSPNDWVAYKLCGEVATDLSQACESLAFDLEGSSWSRETLTQLSLPPEIFPPIKPSGTKLGVLLSAMAEQLGLQAGTPVAVGGGDTQIALVGCGAHKAGQLVTVAGSTTPLQMLIEKPLIDPATRVWTGRSALPKQWLLESNAGPMGEGLEWAASAFHPNSPNAVARFMAEAGRIKPGAEGMFSSLGAQVMNAASFGLPAASLNMALVDDFDGTTRAHIIARAVLEGLAFSVRANVEQILAVPDAPKPEYLLTGGMTRGPLFVQMLADLFNAPLVISDTPEATGLGAALCAGVGAGLYKNLPEAMQALARTHTLEPCTDQAKLYNDLYGEWHALQEKMRDANDLAAGHMMNAILDRAAGSEAVAQNAPKLKMVVTAQMDEAGLARLRQLGEVTYQSYRETMNVLSGEDLVNILQGCNVFITEVDMIDAEALKALPELRVVVSCRGNAVNVDTAACSAFGVPVLNAPGRNADAVADLALGFMLMLTRRLAPANQFLRQPGGEAGDLGRSGQAFSEFLGSELWNKSVGLVGLGAVGRAVAQRLLAFGANILVCDPFLTEEDVALVDGRKVELDELLRESDIVSLHAAVTEGTRGMIGKEQFATMKPGALFVNTARAALVDADALLESLRSGHLAGAGLDVFPVEPPGADDPILQLPNVIATPHIGGNTLEVASHQGLIVSDDLQRLLRGEMPLHLQNKDVLAEFAWSKPRRTPTQAEMAKLTSAGGPSVSDLEQAKSEQKAPVKKPAVIPSKAEKEGSTLTMNPPTASSTRLQMQNVLDLFIKKSLIEPAFQEYAAKHKISMHFAITDLGLDFYLAFADGKVTGEARAPSAPTDMRLKAKGVDLDAILSGKLSGQKAAMSGKLNFSGDVKLAMGMMKIMNEMLKTYTAAREESGGIDFNAVAAPAAATPMSGASVPRTAAASSLPADDPRHELVAVVLELYNSGCITATGGNVSVRLPGNPQELYITPSHLFKGDLRPEMMVRIDLEGNSLDPDALSPSSERLVHTEIYKVRTDVEAIIHAHSPWMTLLMLNELPFLPISADAAFIGEKIPVVPFIMPGTRELASEVRLAIGDGSVAYMQNHGVVVAGSTLRNAANTLEALERTAMLIMWSHAAGRKPRLIPKEKIKSLGELGKMVA